LKTEKDELEAEYAPYVEINFAEMAAANFNWALTSVESELLKHYEDVRYMRFMLYSSRRTW